MSKSKDLEPFSQSTEEVLTNTLSELAKGITGIATSSRKELILSISHIFQRVRGGQFLSTFLNEWKKFKEKGTVKDDYEFTEQGKVCLQELLEFLDRDSPDEIRFNVLKSIFMVAASEKLSDRDSLLPQQFMKISRSLTDGEIVLLAAIWEIDTTHEGDYDKHYDAMQWLQEVANKSGLKYTTLAQIHEKGLIEKQLISKRRHSDESGVFVNPHFRLTDLGYEFCKFIHSYEA